MSHEPKVFISYSTVDKVLAQRLYGDLYERGADVFEFLESAAAGEPAWPQVLEWIEEADVFVLLLSTAALASGPVKAEIGHAHYSHVNDSKPRKLIPAIIEHGAKTPSELKRFTSIDLRDYATGLQRLCKELGLKAKAIRKAPARSAAATRVMDVDLEAIFAEHRQGSPGPSKEERWSSVVAELLSTYDSCKPAGIGKQQENEQIESILRHASGKPPGDTPMPQWITDVLPEGGEVLPADDDAWNLWQAYLHRAPVLKVTSQRTGATLSWTPIFSASNYLLERSTTEDFKGSYAVYEGDATQWEEVFHRGVALGRDLSNTLPVLNPATDGSSLKRDFRLSRRPKRLRRTTSTYFYRVKAKAEATTLIEAWESPWSNVVSVTPA